MDNVTLNIQSRYNNEYFIYYLNYCCLFCSQCVKEQKVVECKPINGTHYYGGEIHFVTYIIQRLYQWNIYNC